ncbi:MAG: hypothetical protein R6V29_05425, partial [Spirochaetia bacterium]
MKRLIVALVAVLFTAGGLLAQETAEEPADGTGRSEERQVTAEEVTIIDAQTAVRLAEANNLGIEVEDIEVRKAKRLVDNAWTVFIPEVSATGRLSRVNEVQDRA